jgi:hypothetical protein
MIYLDLKLLYFSFLKRNKEIVDTYRYRSPNGIYIYVFCLPMDGTVSECLKLYLY